MEAEVLFLHPGDIHQGCAALIEAGLDVEVLEDRMDDYGPAVWILATTITELDESSFFDWVQTIVEPLRGSVLEAGLASPPPATNFRAEG